RGFEPRRGERLRPGRLGHVRDGFVVPGDPARLDPDPGPDPLVAGVNDLGEVVVGHDLVRLVAAEPENLRPDHDQASFCSSPLCSPVPWSPDADPCAATRARAASSWSGVLIASSSIPGSARLAMPVSVPPGSSSMNAVTPRAAIVAMHWSQRTG